MTPQAEALFRLTEQTVDTELIEELTFPANHDQAESAIQEIIDMPDRQIDLFIRFCIQNNGRLSARKRNSRLLRDRVPRFRGGARGVCIIFLNAGGLISPIASDLWYPGITRIFYQILSGLFRQILIIGSNFIEFLLVEFFQI